MSFCELPQKLDFSISDFFSFLKVLALENMQQVLKDII